MVHFPGAGGVNVADEERVTLGVLAERLEGVREDVAELRQQRREDHHRLRNVETAVGQMIDAQKAARESESRQYRRMANAIQFGGLLMAAAMVVLAIVTALAHT